MRDIDLKLDKCRVRLTGKIAWANEDRERDGYVFQAKLQAEVVKVKRTMVGVNEKATIGYIVQLRGDKRVGGLSVSNFMSAKDIFMDEEVSVLSAHFKNLEDALATQELIYTALAGEGEEHNYYKNRYLHRKDIDFRIDTVESKADIKMFGDTTQCYINNVNINSTASFLNEYFKAKLKGSKFIFCYGISYPNIDNKEYIVTIRKDEPSKKYEFVIKTPFSEKTFQAGKTFNFGDIQAGNVDWDLEILQAEYIISAIHNAKLADEKVVNTNTRKF